MTIRLANLTPTEDRIAHLVGQGYSNREISAKLGIVVQSVKNSIKSIFDKLGVWSRLELALYVMNKEREQVPELQ